MKRIDQVHRDVAHELYPQKVTKSTFLETLLEYSLDPPRRRQEPAGCRRRLEVASATSYISYM